jgi:hypothetical protein
MMLRTTRDHEANLVRSRLTPRSASDQASDRSRQSHGSARPTSLIKETAIPCFSEGHLPAHDRNGRAVVIPHLGVSAAKSGSDDSPGTTPFSKGGPDTAP